MEYQNRSAQATSTVDAGLRDYMLRVYNFMAGGLGVTGLVAYILFSSTAIYDEYSGSLNVLATMQGSALYQSPMIYLLMFAPLGVVLYMSFGFRSMSASRAQTMFWIFAILMGLSLSTIFLQYTEASIARVFFITASTFGAMSIYGYTTKRDLTGMGSFLMMGLIGIIIASIVNIFLGWESLNFAISVLGVLIFVGLTAYDTQKIKNMYNAYDSAESSSKKAIMGALTLYLDFINLFIMLLRLFGQRR
jgi:FtsH-binding integral membrane protein